MYDKAGNEDSVERELPQELRSQENNKWSKPLKSVKDIEADGQ